MGFLMGAPHWISWGYHGKNMNQWGYHGDLGITMGYNYLKVFYIVLWV